MTWIQKQILKHTLELLTRAGRPTEFQVQSTATLRGLIKVMVCNLCSPLELEVFEMVQSSTNVHSSFWSICCVYQGQAAAVLLRLDAAAIK